MEKEIKKLEGIEEEKVAAGAGKKCNCYRCNKSLGGWFGDKSCYLYGVSIEDVMLIIDYGGNKK